MALNISAWAIRHPAAPLVLFTLLIALGVAAWFRLPVQAMPTIAVPIISVTTVMPGAAPTDLERQVTRRIEAAIAGVAGVKHITSKVTPGVSFSTVEFRLAVPVDRAANDVRDAVTRIRSELPAGIREPVVERIDITALPILTYAVAGTGRTDDELSWFVADTVVRHLSSVPGVAQVRRDGGIDRELRIELDPAKLAAAGASTDHVDAAVRARLQDLPGGTVEPADQARLVRITGAEAVDAAVLHQLRIPLGQGRTATLGELGRIIDGPMEPTVLARRNNQSVVAFSILAAKGASEVTVARAIQAKLDALEQRHPGIRFTKEVDWSRYTNDQFLVTLYALLEGAALAVLVVFLFLRDWRVTAISALAIPLSILPTFAVMQWFGFSLNGVSLLGLSLVAGVLVDDAIVEVENIVRHQAQGLSPYRASLLAADRIGLAVVATTASIVAVFLPVSAMPGIPGKYFIEFGITVAVAVVASLLVARLLTPLMTAYLLRPDPPIHRDDHRLLRWYTARLAWCVDHRWWTLGIGAVVFALSLAATKLLPSGFLAASDRSQSVAQVRLPAGTTLAQAESTVATLTTKLRERPEVVAVLARIELPISTLTITLVPKDQRTLSQKQFERAVTPILAAVPDQRLGFIGENNQRDLVVQLLGDDAEVLAESGRRLAAEMRRMPTLANITTAADEPRPELRLVPDHDACARLGVDSQRLAQVVRLATQGEDATLLPNLTIDDRQIPVRIQLERSARRDPDLLKTLRVPTTGGDSVPLSCVATLVTAEGAATVERYDQRRSLVIEADLAGTTLGDALEAVRALPAHRDLPAGISLAPVGDAEIMDELFSGFLIAMILGVLSVYLVLALLYQDAFHPITILAALPVSIGGAIIGLALFDKAMDMAALIGLLMLLGIVCKNSILLVDEAIHQEQRTGDQRDALIQAGRIRARPIIMTTLAMIGGMLPAAYGIGEGAEFRSPMAIAVIGGLIASTALSLLFVPAVFSVIDDLRDALEHFGRRFITVPTAEDRED